MATGNGHGDSMANRTDGPDDGIVTSAPASSVGSLLTDLLSEAKKDVAAERVELERQIQSRADDERDARNRDEARKRDAMQQKLIEETRLRNQALSRRDRDGVDDDRTSPGTARHSRPKPVVEVAATQASASAALPQKSSGGVSWLLVAVLALAGVGIGVGGAFALTPKTEIPWPDVDMMATTVAQQSTLAATVVSGATSAVSGDAGARFADLQKQMDSAVATQKKLTAELAATKTELAMTRKDLDTALKSSGKTRRVRRNGTRTGGIPSIDSSVFGKP
ncbi:MAG: hypothetical protein ACI9MR_004437 [Myxococcota bacterium]|jgi:hypothetical protein